MENKHVALVALIERKIKTGRPGKVALEIVGELAKAWADGYNTSALEEGFGPYPPTRWLLRDALIARGYLPPDAPLDLEST